MANGMAWTGLVVAVLMWTSAGLNLCRSTPLRRLGATIAATLGAAWAVTFAAWVVLVLEAR